MPGKRKEPRSSVRAWTSIVGLRLTPCRLGPDSRGRHSLLGVDLPAYQAPAIRFVGQHR
jgi:hypothetical protein